MVLGPLCGIEIRLVHLSACDEAGPATSGRPGRGFVHPPCPHAGLRASASVPPTRRRTRVGSERPHSLPLARVPLPRAANSVVRICTYLAGLFISDARAGRPSWRPSSLDEDRTGGSCERYGIGSRLAGFRIVSKYLIHPQPWLMGDSWLADGDRQNTDLDDQVVPSTVGKRVLPAPLSLSSSLACCVAMCIRHSSHSAFSG